MFWHLDIWILFWHLDFEIWIFLNYLWPDFDVALRLELYLIDKKLIAL